MYNCIHDFYLKTENKQVFLIKKTNMSRYLCNLVGYDSRSQHCTHYTCHHSNQAYTHTLLGWKSETDGFEENRGDFPYLITYKMIK